MVGGPLHSPPTTPSRTASTEVIFSTIFFLSSDFLVNSARSAFARAMDGPSTPSKPSFRPNASLLARVSASSSSACSFTSAAAFFSQFGKSVMVLGEILREGGNKNLYLLGKNLYRE